MKEMLTEELKNQERRFQSLQIRYDEQVEEIKKLHEKLSSGLFDQQYSNTGFRGKKADLFTNPEIFLK